MALTVNSVMTAVMNNPDVAIIGLLAGFIIGYAKGKRSNQMGMGGGGLF